VRFGSLLADNLEFIRRAVTANVDGRPLVGLHIGNFVGVSLAGFARCAPWLRNRLNPDAVVFLDDVTDAWHEIRDAFNEVSTESGSGFVALGHDGRVGALRLV
jgi:hypothetical protein